MNFNNKSLQDKVNAYLNSDKFRNNIHNQIAIQSAYKDQGSIHNVGKINVAFNKNLTSASSVIGDYSVNKSRVIRGFTVLQINGWATGFKTWLLKRLQEWFGEGTQFERITPAELMSHQITNVVKSGKLIISCTLEFSFKPIAVRRKSLNPDRFPNGVDNILMLLSKGWNYTNKTKGSKLNFSVNGTWRNRNICALAFNQNDVLYELIEEYNAIHALDGIVAVLSPRYY